MSPYYHVLYLLIIFISMIIIHNDYKKIKHYESIEKYYKWRNCETNEPPHSGVYLLQYAIEDNNEHQIIVTHYNLRKKEWILPNDTTPVAWRHLPNHLYPNKK